MTLTDALEAQNLTEEEFRERLEINQELQKESRNQLMEQYWNKQFHEILKAVPDKGFILRPMDAELIKLEIDFKKNASRGDEMMEVRLCRAAVDNEGTGWFLTNSEKGIVCLVSVHTFDRCLKIGDDYYVSCLQVQRKTSTGRALICNAM